MPTRIANAVVSYIDYLGQIFYPVKLSVFYPYPQNQLFTPEVAISMLGLILISLWVIIRRSKAPYLVTGWLWYLAMMVPVIGLMQVGWQAHADRYTYLPQIGLYILLVWGAVEICGMWRGCRAMLGIAAGAMLTGLLVAAHAQTTYWQDSLSLWSHALACTSRNHVACYNLGVELCVQGKLDEATQYYQQALKIKPDFADAHYAFANALVARGKSKEAVEHYRAALQLKPDFTLAHYNLGNTLAAQNKWDDAIVQYQQAIQLDDSHIQSRINLGVVLAHQGRLHEAATSLQQALDLAISQDNLALAESIRARLQSLQSTRARP